MRSWSRTTFAVIGICGLLACGAGDAPVPAPVTMPKVTDMDSQAWKRLAARRVFFGHQSVGGNIMDGVADVLKEHPEIGLRVVETADPALMTEPGVYHARVGVNGEPKTKLASFAGIASGAVADSGVALLKYCYVDITDKTDPVALFDAYRRQVAELRAANPGLTVLHVTLPLQTDWGEYFHWKRVIRGKLTTHRELNYIRQAYNQLLRQEYAGREPIFDVAHWQSIAPDGTESTVRYRRTRVPILDRAWTEDGGHLNAAGRLRIAEALLVTLARL